MSNLPKQVYIFSMFTDTEQKTAVKIYTIQIKRH